MINPFSLKNSLVGHGGAASLLDSVAQKCIDSFEDVGRFLAALGEGKAD